jgi:hypothetical protein
MLYREIIAVCFEIHTVWAERRSFGCCGSLRNEVTRREAECWVCAEQTASGEDSNYLQAYYWLFCTTHVVDPFLPFTFFIVCRNQTLKVYMGQLFVCTYMYRASCVRFLLQPAMHKTYILF